MREKPKTRSLLTPLPELAGRYASAIPIGVALWLLLRLIESLTRTQTGLSPASGLAGTVVSLLVFLGCAVAMAMVWHLAVRLKPQLRRLLNL